MIRSPPHGRACRCPPQRLADASPRVAQLRRLQALADGAGPEALQRKTPEEEELLKRLSRTTQRQFVLRHAVEEDGALQKRLDSSSSAAGQRQGNPPSNLAVAHPNGLPEALRTGIKSLSGRSVEHVRAPYNSSKPAQLTAHAYAYAQGSDIHTAPGQDQHLPHEAWHLVQQAQGRVQLTMQLNGGVAVNDDPALEREAHLMGARAQAARG